jgi:hypothetical protein
VITAPAIDVLRMSSDKVLHEAMKTTQSGIIQRPGLRLRRVYLGHRLCPMTIDVV